MSTYRTSAPTRKPAAQKSGSQTVLLIIALLAIVGAVTVFALRYRGQKAEEAKATTAASPEYRIQQIQENPNMPPQAKAMAEAQLRARMQETEQRNAAQPPGR